MEHLVYLLLLLIYLIMPVFLIFQKKVHFVLRVRYLLPATAFSAAIFLMMTWRFTEFGIWSLNPDYLTGIDLLQVPLEMWLAVFVIPFSSVAIYEWLKIRFESFEKPNLFLALSLVLLAVMVILAFLYRSALFTFFMFFLTAIYLGYTLFRNRFKKHLTKFYLAYLITLVPFILVSFLMNLFPILTFDATHIMQIAVLGIPVESFVYLYFMLLINFTIYENISESQFY